MYIYIYVSISASVSVSISATYNLQSTIDVFIYTSRSSNYVSELNNVGLSWLDLSCKRAAPATGPRTELVAPHRWRAGGLRRDNCCLAGLIPRAQFVA